MPGTSYLPSHMSLPHLRGSSPKSVFFYRPTFGGPDLVGSMVGTGNSLFFRNIIIIYLIFEVMFPLGIFVTETQITEVGD